MTTPLTPPARTGREAVECSRCKENERADWRGTDAPHLFGPCPACDTFEFVSTYGEAELLALELQRLASRATGSDLNYAGDINARRLHDHIAQLTRILSMGSAHTDPRTLRNVQEQKNKVAEAALAWFDDSEGDLMPLLHATRELKRITQPTTPAARDA